MNISMSLAVCWDLLMKKIPRWSIIVVMQTCVWKPTRPNQCGNWFLLVRYCVGNELGAKTDIHGRSSVVNVICEIELTQYAIVHLLLFDLHV